MVMASRALSFGGNSTRRQWVTSLCSRGAATPRLYLHSAAFKLVRLRCIKGYNPWLLGPIHGPFLSIYGTVKPVDPTATTPWLHCWLGWTVQSGRTSHVVF